MLSRVGIRARSGLGLLQHSQQLKHAARLAPAPCRWNSGLPVNIGVLFVPQQEAWVVERMGKFHRILEPERESLNASIVDAINQASDCWGIRCLRYEIKDIHVPPRVKESMQMQVEAERRKRATVLESEGTRESAINVAEGQKQAQILASEAEKAEQINKAAGEANAMLVKARAKAEAIQLLAAALAQQHGNAAASLSVAEQYVNAFSKIAKDSNTVLLPANTGDVTNMVAQALGIYTTLTKPQAVKTQDEVPSAHEDSRSPATEMLKAEQGSSS
uniref:Stomatin like 2 n=1 Tax=Catharus ustulatus TaxID=91951 RepID=A0A8C3UB35_CATUS